MRYDNSNRLISKEEYQKQVLQQRYPNADIVPFYPIPGRQFMNGYTAQHRTQYGMPL